jgi:hypothetical protein
MRSLPTSRMPSEPRRPPWARASLGRELTALAHPHTRMLGRELTALAHPHTCMLTLTLAGCLRVAPAQFPSHHRPNDVWRPRVR